jgi:raffinose/stachyose/melibiose transport system substrate-binding protein
MTWGHAMRHRLHLITFAVVLLMVMAACAPSTGGDESAAAGDVPDDSGSVDAVASEAGGDAEAELTVWSWRTEDQAGYERIFDAFEQSHPGITVEFVPHVNTEYDTILATGLTEEGGPDVMQLRAYGGLQPLVEAGNVLPLDDEVPELTNFDDGILEGARGREDGQVYGVPFGVQTVQMFYNREIFDEHGLSEPKTWDEFVQILDTLAGTDVIPMAVTGADIWMLPIVHEVLASTRYGGESFRQRVQSGEVDFTDKDYVASIEVVEQVAEYFPDDVVGVGYTDAQVLFTTGRAAMFPGGSFEVGFFSDQAPDLEMGVFRVPAPPGSPDPDALHVPGWMDGSYGVNPDSPDREAALELVRWMGTPEFGELFTNELRQLSAVPGVAPQDPTLARIAEMYEETPDSYMLLVDFRYGEPTGTDLLGEGLQELLLGETTPSQVAERLQTGVDEWFEPNGDGGS